MAAPRLFASKWTLSYALRSSSWPDLIEKLRQSASFHGVEASLSDLGATGPERLANAALLRRSGLALIVGLYSSWDDYEGPYAAAPPRDHLRQLEAQLAEAEGLGATMLNVHGGDDSWDERRTAEYFAGASALLRGREAAHETHRGRCLFHPAATARVLERFGDISVTLDVSHWFLVCERLSAFADVAELVAPRVKHVHARIGSTQAPQVEDPAVDADAAAAHLAAWRAVLKPNLTWTPEYGPPPYQFDRSPSGPEALWSQTLAAASQLRDLSAGT
ncbi:xylose isomerase-like protein [Pelagophyceae sp. CCMP2097]|nr:xylose isomerase-like protein [Pelagophyceae sp. CCMP2097]